MKCVARKRCQATDDNGRVLTFKRGNVHEFKKCPPHFESLEGDKVKAINFLTASEEELMAAKWKFDDAAKSIKDAFNVEMVKEEGTRKSEVVRKILDARYRSISEADTSHTR